MRILSPNQWVARMLFIRFVDDLIGTTERTPQGYFLRGRAGHREEQCFKIKQIEYLCVLRVLCG